MAAWSSERGVARTSLDDRADTVTRQSDDTVAMRRRNPVLHAIDVGVVAAFAVVFLRAGGLVKAVGPVFAAYLRTGLPGGPNALLTTQGRSSGLARTVPLAR